LTVCITAVADDHEAIVSCVDTRISSTIASFDPVVGRKICGFRGWTILTSGTLPDAEALVDRFQEYLGEAPTNDPPAVQECLEKALRLEISKFTAARYLTPYGLDMPTFLASRQGFTDERWSELNRQIGEYADNYDVELAVSGWGDTQGQYSTKNGQRAVAYIFSVSRHGVAPYGDVGFHACGSGGSAAYSVLSFFNQQTHMTLAHTIYHVAAAKFMSERTEGVGPSTVLRVSRRKPGGWSGYFIQPHEIEMLRKMWDDDGAPRMPSGAESKIVEMLQQHEKGQRVSASLMVERIKEHL
jgi:hypothetical protein